MLDYCSNHTFKLPLQKFNGHSLKHAHAHTFIYFFMVNSMSMCMFSLTLSPAFMHTPINTQLTGNQMPLFVKFHFSSHELIKEAAIDSAALKERAI